MHARNRGLACALAAFFWVGAFGFACAAPPTAHATRQAANAPAVAPARVVNAWVRAAPPGTDMLAGYMDIHNTGKTTLRLVSARVDAFGMAALHRSVIDHGVSSMAPAGAQDIPAGGMLRIGPGGLHWMLMQPLHPLMPGDKVRFTLHFADGSQVQADEIVSRQAPVMPKR